MFSLLTSDEQVLLKQKVSAGNEVEGSFVCDFGCGYSSNCYNAVGSHELYCFGNPERKLNRLEVQLAFRRIFESIFKEKMPKLIARNRGLILQQVLKSGVTCTYQKKVCNEMKRRIYRLDKMAVKTQIWRKKKKKTEERPRTPSTKSTRMTPSTNSIMMTPSTNSTMIQSPSTVRCTKGDLVANFYLNLNKKRRLNSVINKRRAIGRKLKQRRTGLLKKELWSYRWFKLYHDYRNQFKMVDSIMNELRTEIYGLLDSIFKHVPGWLPLWEQLSHTPGDGHCGTLDMDSLRHVLSTLKYIMRLSGIPEHLLTIIEFGCGVLDFAKALHIGFPRANLFCFDIKNYIENVFSDLDVLSTAIRNLRHMISKKQNIGVAELGLIEFKFGVAMRKGQPAKICSESLMQES